MLRAKVRNTRRIGAWFSPGELPAILPHLCVTRDLAEVMRRNQPKELCDITAVNIPVCISVTIYHPSIKASKLTELKVRRQFDGASLLVG
jgi:hypothetical protein